MKLLSYIAHERSGVGVLTAEGTVLATGYRSFDELFEEPDPSAAVAALEVGTLPVVQVQRRRAPLVSRPQLIGTGGNYADHAAEASSEITITEPVFLPWLWSAAIGPDDEIVIPSTQTLTDYEAEFAVVIGTRASRLTRENAMDHVFGFTIVNDLSAREITAVERAQMMLSKSVETFLPVGPVLVTKDEIVDPYDIAIRSYLNGEVRQDSNTGAATLRFDEILTRITASVTLHPGDVVTSGTPGGVGYFRDPPEFVMPGDLVSVEVEGIGRMDNRARAGWE